MSEISDRQKNNLLEKNGVRKVFTVNVLFGLILILGIILRFYDISSESYWIDEMSTVLESQQTVQQLLNSGRLDQPPAYYLPFHFWVRLFGTTELSTRSFSALVCIASIIIIFIIGKILFNKEVALLGAFFMTISEFQIYYSQVARFYSFFELTTLLSFLFFILAFRDKKISQFIFYVLFSILMVYSHTYGVFVLAGQNLFVLLQIKKYKHILVTWIICQLGILLAFIPYLYPLLFAEGSLGGTINSNVGELPSPSIKEPIRSIYHFMFSARRDREWSTVIINYIVAGGFLLLAFAIYFIKIGKSKMMIAINESKLMFEEVIKENHKLLLLCCWLGCPIVLPYILSLLFFPIYKDYYTISAAPAFYLLFALILFNIRKLVPLIISIGVLILMIVPSLGYYYDSAIQEQWREVAKFIEENSKPDEVIVIASNMGIGIQQKSFDWYYQGQSPSCSLSSELIDNKDITQALLQCISEKRRFWVIIPNYEVTHSDDRYRSYFLSLNQTNQTMIKQNEYQFVGLSVYFFELKE